MYLYWLRFAYHLFEYITIGIVKDKFGELYKQRLSRDFYSITKVRRK